MEQIMLSSKLEYTLDDGSTGEGMVMDLTSTTVDFSIPADDRKFKLLHKGQQMEVRVFQKNKGISFKATIVGRTAGDLPTYTLGHLHDFRQVQRRSNVRVLAGDPFSYTTNRFVLDSVRNLTDKEQVMERISRYLSRGALVDLSAGGVKFACEEKLEEGQLILCHLLLGETPVILEGTIVHRQYTVNPHQIRYYYGVQFRDPDMRTQDIIVNHVFRLMRRERKK